MIEKEGNPIYTDSLEKVAKKLVEIHKFQVMQFYKFIYPMTHFGYLFDEVGKSVQWKKSSSAKDGPGLSSSEQQMNIRVTILNSMAFSIEELAEVYAQFCNSYFSKGLSLLRKMNKAGAKDGKVRVYYKDME